MIDYDAVMKALEEEYQWQDNEKVAHEMLNVVKYFPTIEQPHWIPCSERLPETNGEYLVTRASANLYCYIDIVKKTNVSGDIANDIVAWMPMPEPYKEGEQE